MNYVLKTNQGEYDKTARPVFNNDYMMYVDLEFHLRGIKEVDVEEGVMESVGWVGYTWMNEYMQWNPKHFGGIEEIRVPSNMVWVPDIYLFNDASGSYNARVMENKIDVIIYNDGSCLWYNPAVFKSLCDLSTPDAEEVTCPLIFGSWTHDENLINLNSTSTNADLTNFSGNTKWELVEAKATRNAKMYDCCPNPYIDVTWNIKLHKRVPHPDEEEEDDSEEK